MPTVDFEWIVSFLFLKHLADPTTSAKALEKQLPAIQLQIQQATNKATNHVNRARFEVRNPKLDSPLFITDTNSSRYIVLFASLLINYDTFASATLSTSQYQEAFTS